MDFTSSSLSTASDSEDASALGAEKEIDFRDWYQIFRKSRQVVKSLYLSLPPGFRDYLLEDGIFLPDNESSRKLMGRDELSDDEELTEVVEADDEAGDGRSRIPNFPDFDESIQDGITQLDGKVFIKLNNTAPSDTSWVNAGSLQVVNVAQVYLLLKSSSKISSSLSAYAHNVNIDGNAQSSTSVGPVIPDSSCSESNDGDILVLRKWCNYHPAMEFRVFVCNKHLVGVCPRDCSVYYDFLLDEQDEIFDCIAENFLGEDGIISRAPYRSYSCDVYIDKQKKLWIVDFNAAFSPSTKSLLFEWAELSERSVSEAQRDDNAELRLVTCSDDIIPADSGVNRGPIDALDFVGKDLSALREMMDRQREEPDDDQD